MLAALLCKPCLRRKEGGGMKQKLSITYRFLRKRGFNYSEEEYSDVSLWRVIKQFFKNIRQKRLSNMMDWAILEPFAPRSLRPKLLREMGCHVGKDVFVGDHVRIDQGHADLIYIDDRAHITGGCRLLCHKSDLKNYYKSDDAAKLPYKLGEIHIGKGVMIGMESLIMPGVTIGDGAIVGAYSLVTKDIPPYTIATGRPARVVKAVPEKPDT